LVAYTGGCQGLPDISIRTQRRQVGLSRQIAKGKTAPFAAAILEVEKLAAVLAFEEFHDGSGPVGSGKPPDNIEVVPLFH
jgi:hypothetical protein